MTKSLRTKTVTRQKGLDAVDSAELNSGNGALNKALYGEAPPGAPTPHIFIYHF